MSRRERAKRWGVRRRWPLTLLGVIGVAVWALIALAAGPPSAPTTTSGPAGLTNQTSASPKYSDSGVPTVVSIDVAAGAQNPTNTGPLSWTVTFSEPVSNVVAGDFALVTSNLGGAAPTISGLSPSAGPSATYTVTASTTGTTGKTNGSIGLNLVSKGTIEDAAGNALSTSLPVAGQAYTFDTTPPPAPTISGYPSKPSTSESASFTFSDGQSGLSFECSLDDASTPPTGYSACTSPAAYSGLTLASHTFRVYALDQAGNSSTVSSYSWTVEKASPSIGTLLSSSAVIVGSPVHDTALLSGAAATAGGTVTYSFFTNSSCTAGKTQVGTPVTVTNGSAPPSASQTFGSAGTFYWQAVYSGDANDDGGTSACASELLTVDKAQPAVATTATSSVTVGGSLSDSATLSGLVDASGGTLTFALYGNPGCSGTPLYTHTVTGISGNGQVSSGSYTTTAASPGDAWTTSYSGDANNEPVSEGCGGPSETSVVNKAQPTMSITATSTATVGSPISVTATLSGLIDPDGNGLVVFGLFTDEHCLGRPAFVTSSRGVTANGGYGSGGYTPTAPGTYYWAALYTGDSNNRPVLELCGGASDPSTVTKATPSITTKLSAGSISAGGTAYDTSTLTGLVDASGTETVTYTVYDNNSCTRDANDIAAGAVTVSKSGSVPNSNTLTFDNPGTFYWRAVYGGDANNASASSPCTASNNEQLTVTSSSGVPFGIGSNAAAIGTLSPGVGSPIDLSFSNPSGVPIYVTGVSVTITGVDPMNGNSCGMTGNFSIGQQLQLSSPLEIQGNATNVTLQSLSVPQADWPTIVMADNGNQDGCEGATVTLSYSGSAHS